MSRNIIDEENRSNLCIEQIAKSLKDTYVPLYGVSEGHTYEPLPRDPEWSRWDGGYYNCEEYAIIKVGIHHLQVILNAVDDYRSHCEEIVDLISLDRYSNLEFFDHPVAEVRIEKLETNPPSPIDEDEYGFFGATRGWQLVDRDGHVWLQVGTSNYNDYYPCFFLRWYAKPPNKAA